jgi:protein-S-isoprenylcysteine O-methyltransferase Ste14
VPVPARVPLAAAVVVAGILVEAAGAVSFVRARTTVDPLHPSAVSKLVTGGVYRVTRNPMYLGDLLILVGWAVYLATVPALVLVPLFVAYIDRFQISAEERAMEACFGEAYRAYKGRVRRWL